MRRRAFLALLVGIPAGLHVPAPRPPWTWRWVAPPPPTCYPMAISSYAGHVMIFNGQRVTIDHYRPTCPERAHAPGRI